MRLEFSRQAVADSLLYVLSTTMHASWPDTIFTYNVLVYPEEGRKEMIHLGDREGWGCM